MDPHVLHEGKWACEAFLWVKNWVHHGKAHASTDSRLMCLCASKFQQVARQFRSLDFYPALYAEEFIKELNLAEPADITELDDEAFIDVSKLVQNVLHDTDRHSSIDNGHD